jgi:hypothetical protein
MGSTCGVGIAYSIGTPEFVPSFCEVRVARSLGFCVVFFVDCLSFILFPMANVFSVLRFTTSD